MAAVLVAGACGAPADEPGDSGPGGRLDAGPRSDSGVRLDGAVVEQDGALTPDASMRADAGPPGEWQLAPGHFYPAVMPMTLVYPRPDSETAAYARHHWAHAGISYRIPGAVIQGGSWPFYYEIVEGPPGARIGSQLSREGEIQVADSEYGVLSWTPSAADEGSTFTFVVRVTDQEGASVDARWTVTVDASRFLFLSPSGSPASPGTVDSPMRDVADWYRGDPDDDTYAGRIVYFRGGRYTPIGQTGNENLRMDVGVKPMSYIAYPGEEVTIDATRAAWTFWNGTNDVFFAGLTFVGSKVRDPAGAAIANARTISFYGTTNHHRVTFFEVVARDIAPGSVGNDNPAFVWRPSSGRTHGQYWAFVNNTFDTGGPRTSNGPWAIAISCVSYVVFEGNTVIDWSGAATFHDKANDDHITQRNNDLWAVGAPGHALGFTMSNSYDPSHQPGFNEVCWNRIRVDWRTSGGPFAISASVAAEPGSGPVWMYRNSISGTLDLVQTTRFDATFDANVLQGRAWRTAEPSITAGDNFWSTSESDTVFDASGHLAGMARTTHLGTHGADVQ